MKKWIMILVALIITGTCASTAYGVECKYKADGWADGYATVDRPTKIIYSLTGVDDLMLVDLEPDGIDETTGEQIYIFQFSLHYILDSLTLDEDGEIVGSGKNLGNNPTYKMMYHRKGESVGSFAKCELYKNLPELEADYTCSDDGSDLTCSFSFAGTVAEVKDLSVVVRRAGHWDSNKLTLWYSTRMSLHDECTLPNNIVDSLDCMPGTDICADRCPLVYNPGTDPENPAPPDVGCNKFGHFFGSRKCIDEALSEDGDEKNSYASLDTYRLRLMDATHEGISIRRNASYEITGADTFNDYTYIFEAPYDGATDAGFESAFTIIMKNESDGPDAEFSGTGGLESTCVHDDATNGVSCELTYKMHKKLIDNRSIKIFNTTTGWQSHAVNLTHCVEDFGNLEDYPTPLAEAAHETTVEGEGDEEDEVVVTYPFAHLPNANETIVENICVGEIPAEAKTDDEAGMYEFVMAVIEMKIPSFLLDLLTQEAQPPADPNNPAPTPNFIDDDNDGIDDVLDNCAPPAGDPEPELYYNPDQDNFDNDLKGDVCDSDDDNDGLKEDNYEDPCPFDRENTCVFVVKTDEENLSDDGVGLPWSSGAASANGAKQASIASAGCSMIPRAAGGMGGFSLFLLAGLMAPLAIARFRRK